jgi:hypothetical protein
MFRVDDIYDEAKKIIGICDDTKLFRWLGDAVTIISNKADLEGWKGYLDICSRGCSCRSTSTCNSPAGCGRRCITLPREVETVIGVNVGGQPVLGYSQLFEFHLNGPGSCRTICEWKWQDQGNFHCTFRDLITPAKLVAYLQTSEDDGKKLIVYGFDKDGQVLRRMENGQWVNGYLVPTIYGVAIPDAGAPEIARITGVFKDRTAGTVRLSTIDDSGTTGVTLGVYEPDETLPQYRRIQLNRSCNWARVAYIKTNPVFNSRYDHIALKSRVALLLAVQARKHYADLQVDQAHSYEADAARLEIEAQQKAEPPTFMPMQVIDMSNPRDKYDYDIR